MEIKSNLKTKLWLKITLGIILLLIIFVGIPFMILIGGPYPTAEYRKFESFVKNHEAGMTKQEVISKIGVPRGYIDARGVSHPIDFRDRENFAENVSSDTSIRWCYDFYKTIDPPYPYRLNIIFDSDGRSVSVIMATFPVL